MPKTPARRPLAGKEIVLKPTAGSIAERFDVNHRIHHYLIDNLPPAAWTAQPPDGKGRTVAAMVAHMRKCALASDCAH
jgi:hypothetical protein